MFLSWQLSLIPALHYGVIGMVVVIIVAPGSLTWFKLKFAVGSWHLTCPVHMCFESSRKVLIKYRLMAGIKK